MRKALILALAALTITGTAGVATHSSNKNTASYPGGGPAPRCLPCLGIK